jgi:hypothetical protein
MRFGWLTRSPSPEEDSDRIDQQMSAMPPAMPRAGV